MGFIKRWDIDDMQRQVRACGAEINSPYNDGFIAWHCKQDLIRIKYQLDEILRTAPRFAGEEEFVAEFEKDLVWKRLNQ